MLFTITRMNCSEDVPPCEGAVRTDRARLRKKCIPDWNDHVWIVEAGSLKLLCDKIARKWNGRIILKCERGCLPHIELE
jgi:hypothetical protein